MITREQARAVAENFLRSRRPPPGWEGVESILSPEEVRVPERFRDCWTVRVRGAANGMICVSRPTGEVEFAGAVKGEPRAHSG